MVTSDAERCCQQFTNTTLLIQGAKDFVLEAAGPVTLWFTNSDGGFKIRDSVNVTVRGFSPSDPIRVDRSPPPMSQGTLTAKVGDEFHFKLDGDSPDPRHLKPSRNPSSGSSVNDPGAPDVGMCQSWKAGSRSSDGRPDSRGMPSGTACFSLKDMRSSSHADFSVPGSSCRHGCGNVGDQFVFILWRGFSYVIANSSRVTTQDLAIHAAGDMALFEGDGGGGHVYRRLQVVPRNGRIISSNADAFHSSDLERGPTLIDCHFKSMLDDFMNLQTTLLLGTNFTSGSTFTIVHPHTSDQADDFGPHGESVTDQWYGTTEPLSNVRAGDELILYDPASFKEMGRVTAKSCSKLLSPATDQTSALATRADDLFTTLQIGEKCKGFSCECEPGVGMCWSGVTAQHYPVQRLRASVYSVELTKALPPNRNQTGAIAAIPFVVQIAKTQGKGAVVRDSLFEDSRGFFGRWKASDSVLRNSTFRGNVQPELEISLLPQFYEGPITIANVSIVSNSFEVSTKRKCSAVQRLSSASDGAL